MEKRGKIVVSTGELRRGKVFDQILSGAMGVKEASELMAVSLVARAPIVQDFEAKIPHNENAG